MGFKEESPRGAQLEYRETAEYEVLRLVEQRLFCSRCNEEVDLEKKSLDYLEYTLYRCPRCQLGQKFPKGTQNPRLVTVLQNKETGEIIKV